MIRANARCQGRNRRLVARKHFGAEIISSRNRIATNSRRASRITTTKLIATGQRVVMTARRSSLSRLSPLEIPWHCARIVFPQHRQGRAFIQNEV